MDSMDKASLASLLGVKGKRKKKDESPEERNARIDLYAERVARGQCIWTGTPLSQLTDENWNQD